MGGILTDLSPDHKYTTVEDASIQRLLDLDETIMEVGGGFWVEIKAKRVEPSTQRPAGVSYSLCLYDPGKNERLICFDNAHPVSVGSGPSKKQTPVNDHQHKGKTVKPYSYKTAEDLLVDFWAAVDDMLKKEGVQ